jgi:hypothetical protein
MAFISFLKNSQTYIDAVETFIMDQASTLVSWFAPIPSAYLVSRATINHFHWGLFMGIITAGIIEILGFTTVYTTLVLWTYNRNRRKVDETAPVQVAAILIGFYLAATTGLTVFLDINPQLAHFSPVLFPSVALVGMVNLGLHRDHKRRLESIANEKAERKEIRQANRQANRQDSSDKSSNHAKSLVPERGNPDIKMDRLQAGRKAKLESRQNQMLTIFKIDPHKPIADVAREMKVSRETVYSYMEQLTQQGRIHKNGNGVEVIG